MEEALDAVSEMLWVMRLAVKPFGAGEKHQMIVDSGADVFLNPQKRVRIQ